MIGSIVPSLYFDQLIGRKEVQYDWAKFVWIGSPVQGESQMYMRADTPYKTIEDVRAPRSRRGAARREHRTRPTICRSCSRKLSAQSSISSTAIRAGRRSI